MRTKNLTGVCRWMLVVCAMLAAVGAKAQDVSGQTIEAVRLQGLDYVADQEQTIRSRLEIRPGRSFTQVGLSRAVARDIRRIWDMGYFTHIAAESSNGATGLIITFVLEEKQLIDEIRILGMDKVRERLIRTELNLREGDAFTGEALPGEVEAIIGLYESRGFANAHVEVVAEPVRGGQARRIIYSIDEGRKARIRSIDFSGNDVLRDRNLRKLMQTKTAKWFIGGLYEGDKLEHDLQKILDEYGDYGRLEAMIANVDIAFTDNGKGMNILIDISEGPEYTVETLSIADNIVYEDEELLKGVETLPLDVHDKSQVLEDAQALEQGYRDSGYVNAIVTPQVTLNRETKTTTVIHQINEGDLKYIRQITIAGNSITKDEIIRRQMLLEPGDRYDGAKREMSEERIARTGYFDDEEGEPAVRMSLEDVPEDDRYTDLFLDVAESGKTRTANFGLGYSFEEGLGGSLGLNWQNFDLLDWPRFTGGGQSMKLQLSVGEVRNQYSLSFTDPEFMGYPISAGFDVYQQTYRVPDANYRTDTNGFQLRLGKSLSPYVTLHASAGYVNTDVNDTESLSSSNLPFGVIIDLPFAYNRELQRARGKNTTISTRWSIERNTIDNRRDPRRGSTHELALEVAGFGGDYEYTKIEHDSNWYLPISSDDKWTLSLRTREGWVSEYGSSDFVPLEARFYAGGTYTVRGYDFRDIGPRETGLFIARRNSILGIFDMLDINNYQLDQFSVGGEAMWVSNVEVKYRLHERLSLFGFFDAGAVWRDNEIFEFDEMRYSVGVGLGLVVPVLGPVRLDYGFPLNADEHQGNGMWHLNTTFLTF